MSPDSKLSPLESRPLGEPARRSPEEARLWWEEQWLSFPTVALDGSGRKRFWAVPADSGVYHDDWPLGARLAEQTVAQMRRFPEGSAVLRRILRDLDYDSTVGQGFVARIEELLCGGPGAEGG